MPCFLYSAVFITAKAYAVVGNDGSFNHTIPISAPEARAGLDLKFALNYNSNMGTGLAGKGWSLSGIPAVQLDTAYPVNHDENDRYIGRNGRLIKQASGAYMHQVADFTAYEKYGNCGGSPCGFIETLTNNTKLYYGNSDLSQPVCDAGCHDGGTGKPKAWFLYKMQDVHGNYLTVEYADDLGEKYPVKIRYNRHESLSHQKEIHFVYGYRDDYWKRWFFGKSSEMRKRLEAVMVYGDVYYLSGIAVYSKLTHWYELMYSEKPDGTSLLDRLKFYDSVNHEVPEAGLAFTYDTGEMTAQKGDAVSANHNFPLNIGPPTRRTFQGDFDGNGFNDVLFTNGGNIHLSLNNNGNFTEMYSSNVTPYADNYHHLTAGDFDGDGISDLLLIRSDKILLITYRSNQWISRSVYTVNGATETGWPHALQQSSRFFTGDFNGDSKPDIAYYSDTTGFLVLPNLHRNGWSDWMFAMAPVQWSSVSNALDIIPGDFDGDGKTDFFYRTGFSHNVILAQVSKFSVPQNWYSTSPGLPFNNDNFHKWIPADYNGDGKTDLLYAGHTIIVLLSTGQGFLYNTWRNYSLETEYQAIECCYGKEGALSVNYGKFTVGDFNADGKADLVFWRTNRIIVLGISNGNGFNFSDLSVNFSLPPETFLPQNTEESIISDILLSLDIDSNTTDDLLLYTNSGSQILRITQPTDKLSAIEKADGTRTQIEYKDLVEEPGAFNGNLSTGPHFSRYPRKLVKTIAHFMPDLGNANTSDTVYTDYTYAGAAVYAAGPAHSRNLGFNYIGEKDRRTGKLYRRLFHRGEYNSDMIFQDSLVNENTSKWLSTGQYSGNVNITGIKCTENGCPWFENYANPDDIIHYYSKPDTMLRPYFLPSSKNTYDDIAGQTNTLAKGTRTEYIKTNRWGQYTHTREQHSAPGVERYVNTHTNFINATYPHRLIGLVSEKKVCLSDCTGSNLLSHERFYYDNLPLGQVGSKGLVTRKETLAGERWLFTNFVYDEFGNVTESVDSTGIARVIEYESDFRQYATKTYVRGAFNSIGDVKLFTGFDPRWGVPTSITDENGLTENNFLDNRGRILQKNIMSGGTNLRRITYEYSDQPGNRYREECRRYGFLFMFRTCNRAYFDAAGREIRKVSPTVQGEEEAYMATRIEYDTLGRKLKESRPYFTNISGIEILSELQWTITEYNDRDKPIKTIAPDGKITQATYSPSLITGSTSSVEVTDARGLKTRSYADIYGQTLRTTEVSGTAQQTQLDNIYNERGQLIEVQSPAGNTVIEWSVANNQRSKIIDPNAGISRWAYYDAPGTTADNQVRLEHRYAPNTVLAAENATEFLYDELGRLYKIQNPSATITYNHGIYAEEYNIGRIAGIQKKGENYVYSEKYKYSPLGEITSVIRIHRGAAWSNCDMQPVLPCYAVTAMEYDDLGRVHKVIQPDGEETVYEYYFATNKVKSIAHNGSMYVQYKAYDITGRSRHITYGNGLVTTSEYDALTLMPRIISTHKDSAALLDWEYSFDQAGNITQIADHVLPERTATMTYDNLNRLQSVTRNGSMQNYAFDSKGNLTTKSLVRNTYSGTRIISNEKRESEDEPWQEHQSFGWSSAGNLLSRAAAGEQPGFNYEYDDDYMMSKAIDSNGNLTRFFYDHGGQRFLKIYERQGYPGIYTYYINDYLEIRHKRESSTFVAQQVSRTLRGAHGERIATLTDSVQTLAYNTSGQYKLLAQATDGNSINSQLQAGMYRYMSLYAKLEENKVGGYVALLLILVLFTTSPPRNARPLSISRRGVRLLSFSPSPNFLKRGPGGEVSRLTAIMLIVSMLHMANCSVTGSIGGSVPNLTPGAAAATIDSLYDGLPAGTFYYTGDHLGSSSLVTNANGDEVLRISYDSYGSVDLSQSGRLENGTLALATEQAEYGILAVRFTGQEYDPETGLYYYNARYYDPQLGIFTTADSWIPTEYLKFDCLLLTKIGQKNNLAFPKCGQSLEQNFLGRSYEELRDLKFESPLRDAFNSEIFTQTAFQNQFGTGAVNKQNIKSITDEYKSNLSTIENRHSKILGHNRYLYVLGNPVRFTDSSGHGCWFFGWEEACSAGDEFLNSAEKIITRTYDTIKAGVEKAWEAVTNSPVWFQVFAGISLGIAGLTLGFAGILIKAYNAGAFMAFMSSLGSPSVLTILGEIGMSLAMGAMWVGLPIAFIQTIAYVEGIRVEAYGGN